MTTDEPGEQLDPVAPEDEARIRALLSSARETGSMPADVVARMDQALAGVAAERTDPVPADNVVALPRTRRHRVVALLGAAAAVAVLGVGIGAFLEHDPGSMDDTSADSAVDRGDAPAEAAARDDSDLLDGTATNMEVGPNERRTIAERRAFVVRSRHLSQDVARIKRLVLPAPAGVDYRAALVHAPEGFACRGAHWGRGVLVAVRYDGAPAFVAFREPMGDSQVVEVLQCGTGDLLRSTTLPSAG